MMEIWLFFEVLKNLLPHSRQTKNYTPLKVSFSEY